MEQETKRCPYCGEEILSVAKKCKHCGEWLEQVNSEIYESPSTVSSGNKNNGHMLYCKNCNSCIHINATQCPNCGDTDPFLFEEIKKEEKESHIPWWMIIIFLIAVERFFSWFGKADGILNWGTWQTLVFLLVLSLYYYVCKRALKEHVKSCGKIMAKTFYNAGDRYAWGIWRNKVRTIIGETLSDFLGINEEYKQDS